MESKQPKIICMMTATGGYNLGDELILLQEYTYLHNRYPKARFTIFTYDEKSSLLPSEKHISYITYFPCGFYKNIQANFRYLWDNILAIYYSDLIVIGWGELVYETEVQTVRGPLLYWILRVLWIKMFQKTLLYFSLGINISPQKASVIKFLFGGAKTFVSVRDKKSQDILSAHHIGAALIEDSVFTYSPSSIAPQKGLVGISLREGYIQNPLFLTQMVAFLEKKGYTCVFLSQSLHPTDAIANDELFVKKLFPKATITHTLTETLAYYPRLNFVVGMRLHALILAFAHRIPFIALSYSKKTEEFLKIIEHAYSLSCSGANISDFEHQFELLLQQEEHIKFAFKEKSLKIGTQILHNLNNLLHGVEKSFR